MVTNDFILQKQHFLHVFPWSCIYNVPLVCLQIDDCKCCQGIPDGVQQVEMQCTNQVGGTELIVGFLPTLASCECNACLNTVPWAKDHNQIWPKLLTPTTMCGTWLWITLYGLWEQIPIFKFLFYYVPSILLNVIALHILFVVHIHTNKYDIKMFIYMTYFM